VVGDNRSTDRTAEICNSLGCIVRPFDTGNFIPIEVGLWFKNNSWKESETDWSFIIDCDEFLDMSQEDLIEESNQGATLIRTTGWDIFNLKEDYDIENMDWGCPNKSYNKFVLLNKSKIREMNFSEGGHYSNPEGDIILSKKSYNLLHKKYVNIEYVCKKYEQNLARLHPSYIKQNFGSQYLLDRDKIAEHFEKHRKLCIKLKKRSS
jgi:hypothetical protein